MSALEYHAGRSCIGGAMLSASLATAVPSLTPLTPVLRAAPGQGGPGERRAHVATNSRPHLGLVISSGHASSCSGGSGGPCFTAAPCVIAAAIAAGCAAKGGSRRRASLASTTALPGSAVTMSPMTAKLVALDIMKAVQPSMQETPKVWITSLDLMDWARRSGQTLWYLQKIYPTAPQWVPTKLQDVETLGDLFTALGLRCSEMMDILDGLLGEPQEHEEAVPKFYVAEMRRRRDCTPPQPPERLSERSLLSFLAVEVVGFLRLQERTGRLAEGEHANAASCKEALLSLNRCQQSAATELVATMVAIFGEKRTEAELKICIAEEGAVLDANSGHVRTSPLATDDYEDEDDYDDDDLPEDTDDSCPVPRQVYIVSDCTGESAESTIKSALGQFGHCFDRASAVDITTFRFCDERMIPDIVFNAAEIEALIVFTLVDPTVNSKMVDLCEEHGVEYHDLWTPLLTRLEGYFDTNRTGVPGRRQLADDRYMSLIDCIEYTRKVDDGVLPHMWAEADIMVIGPSRAGKTPLSFFMAQRGFKVANYPLVPEEPVPKELWDLRQDRVFALTITPAKLSTIRNSRMKTLKMSKSTKYASHATCAQEMQWCNDFYRRNPKWTVLDTTDSGIEEVCARILFQLEVTRDNPSAI